MSVRAIKARIVCDENILDTLWRTHRVFNDELVPVLRRFNELKRGEDATHSEHARAFIWGVLRQDAKYAYDRIIKAASGSTKNTTAKGWFEKEEAKLDEALRNHEENELKKLKLADEDLARAHLNNLRLYRSAFDLFVNGWRPLATLRQQLECLPKFIEWRLYQEAVAIISGHGELMKLWQKDHEQWLNDRTAWESGGDQKKYLALKHFFDTFEKAIGGKVRQRRGRWHKYLDFLRANPQLAAWRGSEAKVSELDEAAIKRVQKARPRKRRSVEAEEFWKLNPELRALDKLHGEYEKMFVRRGKPKRNPDGFKHRPTFTEPGAALHPRWFVFSAPQTKPAGWKKLLLPETSAQMGSIDLLLLTGDKSDDGYPASWKTIRFKADPRLSDFKPTVVKAKSVKRKSKGDEIDKPAFVWLDRQINRLRDATIGGVKLMFDFRGDRTPIAAFLVFTCKMASLPLSDRAKEAKNEFSEEKNAMGKSTFKGRKLPDGLVSLAVDLGIRHVGFATLARWSAKEKKTELLRVRNIQIGSPQTGAPDLASLAGHKKTLRRRRGQRGDPIKGESSHIELQQHVDNMAEDRFKKAARAIINLALNTAGDIDKKTMLPFPRADVLILENLANLLPDAEKERGINTALIEFNRGQLVDRVKQLADDVGLKVFEISPVGTSQVCHRCGSLGRRYSIRREAENKGEPFKPVIHFGPTESLFACPKCNSLDKRHADAPFTCNSDYNAACNLQKRFYLGDQFVSAYPAGQAKKSQRDAAFAQLDPDLNARLRRLHRLDRPKTEIPVIELPW
jgi:hypothetical protein